MHTALRSPARKGRISLSIDQDILDRLEPYKQDINFSAEAERLFAAILMRLENRNWVQRNSDALIEHGKAIAKTGLAGEEFDRI